MDKTNASTLRLSFDGRRETMPLGRAIIKPVIDMKYIGTKTVEAELMTMGEAYERNLLKAGRVPSEEEKDDLGFKVTYEGGYESWSPAKPFHKAYRPANDYYDRMIIEQEDLLKRIDSLKAFLDSEKPSYFDEKQEPLMKIQLRAMETYNEVLKQRIKRISARNSCQPYSENI